MRDETWDGISRRDLLRLAGAGVAACLAGTAARRPAAAMAEGRLPIGLQLWSVRFDCEKNLEQTLAAVARMGYQGVEFAGYHGRAAAALRRLLDDNGLRCCGTHTSLASLLDDELARTIEFNKTLGNKFLIVPHLGEERRRTLADWKTTAALFSELAEKCAPHGMRVGYHNHDFEFRALEGETLWDAFFATASAQVVMQIDVGNCLVGGGDPLTVLKRYPGRAVTIHLKEHSKTKPDAFIGEGDVLWKEVFEICETSAGTEWYIAEYEREGQPALPAVARCLENLRRMGK
jgi:sugar phosphate isomerase/epimerase